MGTRSGDVDPGVIMYLWRTAGMSVEDIETMLNRRSGVSGLSGEIDFRMLHQRIESGDDAAQLAYDVYMHRLRKYVGAYLALLGSTDVITFTAGVGENDAAVRRDALSGLAALGIELDEHLNASPAKGPRRISADDVADHRAGHPHRRGAGDRSGVRWSTGVLVRVDAGGRIRTCSSAARYWRGPPTRSDAPVWVRRGPGRATTTRRRAAARAR